MRRLTLATVILSGMVALAATPALAEADPAANRRRAHTGLSIAPKVSDNFQLAAHVTSEYQIQYERNTY